MTPNSLAHTLLTRDRMAIYIIDERVSVAIRRTESLRDVCLVVIREGARICTLHSGTLSGLKVLSCKKLRQ